MPYFLKRLLWIPVTLFFILLINFLLIHCVKEEPFVTGSLNRTLFENESIKKGPLAYLDLQTSSFDHEFREHYGLDLPLLLNLWPFKKLDDVEKELKNPRFFVKAPYVLEQLSELYQKQEDEHISKMLVYGALQKVIGRSSFKQSQLKAKQIEDVLFLETHFESFSFPDFKNWLEKGEKKYRFQLSFRDKIKGMWTQTQLAFYFKKVFLLDFGSLRGDITQSAANVVMTHFKRSLTLLLPSMGLVFILSSIFGLGMALQFHKKRDLFLTLICMLFVAIPLYIMIPLLIEKVGIPYGFSIHGQKSFFLPSIALIYGSLALYTRLSKTLFLYLLNQKHLWVAKAKGLGTFRLLFVHTLRQALMTLIPLFLGSIGTFLSGLILVETLFEIKGFGFLFYQSIIQKDYHVLLFSTLLASFLSMSGYFFADLFMNRFDPRIRFNDQITSF